MYKFNETELRNIYQTKAKIRDGLNRRYIDLKHLFPEGWNYGSGILTGGAIGCLLRHEEPKDWDIFFRDSDDICLIGETFYGSNTVAMEYVKDAGTINKSTLNGETITSYHHTDDEGAFYGGELDIVVDGVPKVITDNAVSMKNGLQLITMHTGSIEQIHSTFDFIHCTAWYDIEKDKLHISSEQYILNVKKKLKLLPLVKKAPTLREKKYLDRGFEYLVKAPIKLSYPTVLANGPILIDNFAGVNKKVCNDFDQFLATGVASGSMSQMKSHFVNY